MIIALILLVLTSAILGWKLGVERTKPKKLIVKHFKHELYEGTCLYLYTFEGIGIDTDTGKEIAVYRALYEPYELYCRPYDEFCSEVDHKKYPDIKQTYRFEVFEGDISKVNK